MRLDKIVEPSTVGKDMPALTVNYTDSTHTLTIQIAEQATPIVVDISALLATPGARDCSVFAVFSGGSILNVFAATYPSKQSTMDYLRNMRAMMGESTLVQILVPSADDVNTVSLRMAIEDGRAVTFTGDLDVHTVERTPLIESFPTVTFGAPTVSESVLSVPVTASANVDMYFESTLGVVVTPYIKGSGTVIVSLADIPAGMTGYLKASFKYWSNVAGTEFTS